MSESFKDQLSRLRRMASDDGDTWDLSTNDSAAITAVLESHERLLNALTLMLDKFDPDHCGCDPEVGEQVREAIAKAEGQ